ncbi:MAG TPA: helix-turn-helix transcriptional regulator [Streptosporangiaceae bacterium]|jgi:AraC-like DNA-binding protein
MATAQDMFTRFVDSLASHLDDHEARGEDLAARLYLSRYHFDRVVSAVAGESPARFRRRVLLERSAYRLLTSGRSILEVAVEAGYSSHEAYTRAFQREYGAPPSAWRAAPCRFQLAAPNGVHFQPPGSLRLPARTKVTSMDLLTKMVEHHIWLVGEMIERAAQLPAERLDEQIELSVDEDQLTMRGLLSRLIGQMDMWNCAIANREYDWSLEDHESVETMRGRLARVAPAFLTSVRDVVDNGRLDETFVDALCEPAEVFTYGGMIAHVLTFAAHNRTLVILALKRSGAGDLGWGDPMRWVAEPA